MVKKRKTELDVDPSAEIEEPEVPVAPPPAAVEEAPPKKPKVPLTKKQKIIIAALLGGLLLIGAIVFFVSTRPEKPPEETPKEVEKERPKPPPVELVKLINFDLDPFTLPQTVKGETRFWVVGVSLQLSNKETVDEIEQNLILFREAVYMFLKEKGRKVFQSPEKRKNALFDLQRILDRSLQNGRVEKVLITESTLL